MNTVLADVKELRKGGIIAQAFAKQGGEDFEDEFGKTGPVAFGKMLPQPSRESLDCKYVYHIGLKPWKDNTRNRKV